MAAKRKRFIIIDGNALIHRAFHALPALTSPKGEPVNAVFGFSTILLRMFKELKPDYIAATFDLAGPTFRHQEFADYKAQRAKAPDELYAQIPVVKELVKSFHIPIFEKEGFEADDMIGTLSAKAKNVDVMIVTGDMDTLQLVDAHTHVYTMKKGMGETTIYDPAAVKERYGLTPEQMIDYKALRGDPSDNIPGVAGIGEKTASELLKTFGTIEKLYEALKKNSPKAKALSPSVRAKLEGQEKVVEQSKKLVTIVRDVPIAFSINDAARTNYNRQAVVEFLKEVGFHSLLTKLPDDPKPTQSHLELSVAAAPPQRAGQNYQLVQTLAEWKALEKKLSAVSRLAVDTETTGLDPFSAKLLGVSVAWEAGEAYYVSLVNEVTPDLLKPMLENTKIEKVGHNMKYDYQVLRSHGIEMAPLSFDTMIASYLLNAGTRQHNLDSCVFAEFGYEMMPIEALIGKKGKNQLPVEQVPVERLSWYSCEDADFTWRLAEKYAPRLRAEHQERLFREIEMPLVGVLAHMEEAGVLLDTDHLESLSRTLGKKIETIRTKVTELAGEEFNLSSPIQLKKILFEKLQLASKGLGKTKTGVSTAADELEKLRDAHPIVPLIMEYREYTKLKSTYLDALPELVSPKDHRLHTSFNQTVAATGRLSSSDPNLQNIPIRTEWGQKIRQAFIAPPRMTLVSADYSQFELRIVASIANDEKMLAAFTKGEDIHARTAAEVHNIAIDKVTPQMRRDAKAINFGIIYGLGSTGLAQSTGMSREEARAFIERYLETFNGIAQYIEETKALAHKLGYAETLFGRRRKLPDLKASNPMLRAAAERMAINMPVQGTQADVIKMAMVQIEKELPQVSTDARMLLQVHDELVFEVPEKDVAAVSELVKETMEGVHKFKAPIEVEVHVGENWDEAH